MKNKPNPESSITKYTANTGFALPIHYNGSIIFITPLSEVEINHTLVGYETKTHLANALAKNQIKEVK